LSTVTVTALGNNATSGSLATGFDLTATFAETSKHVPTQDELDTVVKAALSSPAAESLVSLLNNMVSTNPITNVDSVAYSTTSIPTLTLTNASSSPASLTAPIVGGLAAALAMLAAGVGAVSVKRRRHAGGGSVRKPRGADASTTAEWMSQADIDDDDKSYLDDEDLDDSSVHNFMSVADRCKAR
jgi:hypothetical protein